MAGSVIPKPKVKRNGSTAPLLSKSYGRPPSGAITNTAANASKRFVILTTSSGPMKRWGSIPLPAIISPARAGCRPPCQNSSICRAIWYGGCGPKAKCDFKGHWLYAGQAFAGLPIAFRPSQQEDCFEVFFSWKRIGQVDFRRLPTDKNSRVPIREKLSDLRIEDSQNLSNANDSHLPLRRQPALKDAQRRNGINGGDPRSGAEAVYAGFADP